MHKKKDVKEGDGENTENATAVDTEKQHGCEGQAHFILGYENHDLEKLNSSGPAASRRARSLQLMTTARRGWSLAKGNVTAGFLQ